MARKLLTVATISLYLLAVGSLVEFALTIFVLSTNGLLTGDDVDKKLLASLLIALIASVLSGLFVVIHTILAWKSINSPNYTLVRNPLHITCTWVLRFVIILWSISMGFGLEIVANGLRCGQRRPEEDAQNIVALCTVYTAIVAIATTLAIFPWAIAANIKANRRPYSASILSTVYNSSTRQSSESTGLLQDSSRDTLFSIQDNRSHSRDFGSGNDGNWYELGDMSGRPQNTELPRPLPQARLPDRFRPRHNLGPSQTRRHEERQRPYTNFPHSRAENLSRRQGYLGHSQEPSARASRRVQPYNNPYSSGRSLPSQSRGISNNSRGSRHYQQPRQPPSTSYPRGPRAPSWPTSLSFPGIERQIPSRGSPLSTVQNIDNNTVNRSGDVTGLPARSTSINVAPGFPTPIQRPEATSSRPRPDPRVRRSAPRSPEQSPSSSTTATSNTTVHEPGELSRILDRRTIRWEDEEIRDGRLHPKS